MAIQFTSFAGRGPDVYAQDKERRAAAENQRAEERESLLNAFQELKNQYAPKRFQQEEEQLRLSNYFNQAREPYARDLAQNEVGLGRAQIENMNTGELGKAFKDVQRVGEIYGQDSREYQLVRSALENKMQRDQYMHLTPNQREAADLFGYGTEEYKQELARRGGNPTVNREGIPKEATPFENMNVNERNNTIKDMRAGLAKANNITSAVKILDEMEKIMKEHPNMSEYFTPALLNGEPTVWEKIKRRIPGTDKKALAAVEKFRKLSNDLVLKGAEGLGAKNATDARVNMLALTKPGEGNTYEANEYLIKRLRGEFDPWVKYGERVKKGLANRYSVEQDLNYGIEDENLETPKQNPLASHLQPESDDMVTITNPSTGEVVTIPRAEWEASKKK